MVPTRHQVSPAVRARFGDRVDRLAPFLTQGDPAADAAVEALAALPAAERQGLVDRVVLDPTASRAALEGAPAALLALRGEVQHVPYWFDLARANRGGAAFLQSGLLGGLVLGLRSLVGGYLSPAGNKPLVFSGRLQEDTARRLVETSRFVQVVSLPDGLRPGAEGFRTTVRVRLIHAQVRRMLTRSPRWNADAWGAPINQFDMAGTLLLFSYVMVHGLRQLGYQLGREASEDILHLWRYAGHLMGVCDELRCVTEPEAAALLEMIEGTQAPPDADSRSLAAALIENPVTLARTDAERARAQRFVRFAYGLSRYLIGDAYADHLGYPRTRWRYALPAISSVFARADAVRRGIPFTDRLALQAGVRYWQTIIQTGMPGGPITFAMPEQLRPVASAGAASDGGRAGVPPAAPGASA